MKTADSIEEYLAEVPEPQRSALNKLRATIRSVVPVDTTESISYGMPTFKYKGALVGVAAFKEHCSLFPYSGELVKEFEAELRSFSTAKGTIRFTPDRPLPDALVKKLVKARIAQNEAKKKRAT